MVSSLLIALANLLSDMSHEAATRTAGVDLQTPWDRMIRFEAEVAKLLLSQPGVDPRPNV